MKAKNSKEHIKSIKMSIAKLNILRKNGPVTKVTIYSNSNQKPCVSCIILCYNSERFLGDAIRSLFLQDFKEPFEIIIAYDRGTTDGTLSKLMSVLKENLEVSKKIELSILFHNNTTEFRAGALALKYARREYMSF